MARIPAAELERLKNEVSVQRLVESAGIELKKSGKDFIGCCPFHADDTASLVVTPAKNLWHCFGCGAAGGPIDWMMRRNGVSFRHAVELLREGIPSLAAEPVKHATVRKLPAPVSLDADDQKLLAQAVDYYHETLKRSPEALAYLEKRGIIGSVAEEAINTFKLGFADRTLGLRLPAKNRTDGAEIRARLLSIGILRESGHEHFNGSLIMPVLDEDGQVQEIYGRKITERLRSGTPLHLYLPGPHRGVWNVQALAEHPEIILCEALIDALTFWCNGYRNVTSSYGIEGFTEDLIAAFKQYGTKRVLIAYDRDEAGERGAAKVAEQLLAAGIECYRIQFPKGMDANSYALKVQPAGKALGVVIRKAVWMGKPNEQNKASGITTQIVPSLVAATSSKPVCAPQPKSASEPAAILEPEPVKAPEPVLEPLPASPVPEAMPDTPVEVKGQDILMTFGEDQDTRRYRVRGLNKNLAVDTLKVNLLVCRGVNLQGAFYVDTLDLYNAKQRGHYIAQAVQETGIAEAALKRDLGRVLLALEQAQDEKIAAALNPEPPQPGMSETEHDAALALLKAPDLLERVLADFEALGLVGERTNKLTAFLATVSRKLAGPLAVVVQSTSAAGKSALMDAVLALVPEADKVKYSAMTGQSLYYMGESCLKHKILAISEEEGASRASYALKLLQSEGELTMASTGKDPETGNLITQTYRVEGPVMIFLTTTAIDIDEELLNRCIVLTVDEGRAQTEAIHRLQRQKRTLEGLQAKQIKQSLTTLHQNAQRLLKPLAVVNPYAEQLTFLSDKTRTRRDHDKYLTLIDAIALLHQHQRPVKTLPGQAANSPKALEYIEVTPDDILAANALAHEVLGRSLDELPPQTRKLLALLVDIVNQQCADKQCLRNDIRLSRKEIRDLTGWGDTQLRVHLDRLVQMEYLLTAREGNGGGYRYELVYDGDAVQSLHLSGLIDPQTLQSSDSTTVKSRGDEANSRDEQAEVAERLRPDCAPFAAGLQSLKNAAKPDRARVSDDDTPEADETHLLPAENKTASYLKNTSYLHPAAPIKTAIPLAATGN
jgi:DNA primase catalytic core